MEHRLRAPTTESDRDLLWALHCASMREYIEKTWGWDETWQREDFDRRLAECTVSIIEIDNESVGALWLEMPPDSIYVSNIHVRPDFQRRGIGAAVMREVMARATAKGISVTLSVLEVNPEAQRLYERLGFTVTGHDTPFIRMAYST